MKIAMIGAGYVGLVTGTCLSDLGHEISIIDIDKEKISKLKKGIVPIYEPGLKELIERNVSEGRLSFFSSIKEGIKEINAIFIAVGTPQGEDGGADLKHVLEAAREIGNNIESEHKLIVIKSTVPVGTSESVKKEILKANKNADIDVVSNPEFLKEGSAIRDFMIPDRIVVGVDNEKSKEIMNEVYRGIERTGKPILYTDIKSSEIIKYASNAMLATRISFINSISQLAEKYNANIAEISKGIGLDDRIGPRFLHAGIGYGGSCFPKDVKALMYMLKKHECDAHMLEGVEHINKSQRRRFIHKIISKLDVKGKNLAVWGLSFKPKTDDLRDAPSIEIIKTLQEHGAKIKAFDPESKENAKKVLPDVILVNKPYEALKGCEALIILTEWDEFRNIDLEKARLLLNKPMVFDGRNIYDIEMMRKNKFKYYSIGRPDIE